jgi:hypothetical protein
MLLLDNDFRTVFWIALIPGLLSVVALFWPSGAENSSNINALTPLNERI